MARSRATTAPPCATGLAATGKTITAAALIMILVFGSFILGGERVIKEFGLGLAAGILMDAVLIRMAIVPSVMFLLGRANWWFPGWLDRVLPRLSVVDPRAIAARSSAGWPGDRRARNRSRSRSEPGPDGCRRSVLDGRGWGPGSASADDSDHRASGEPPCPTSS